VISQPDPGKSGGRQNGIEVFLLTPPFFLSFRAGGEESHPHNVDVALIDTDEIPRRSASRNDNQLWLV
jgi:hypothetical protein